MDVLKSLPPAPTGGPNAAVDSVLPPAGLIGVDHRTAADAFQRFSYGRACCATPAMAPALSFN